MIPTPLYPTNESKYTGKFILDTTSNSYTVKVHLSDSLYQKEGIKTRESAFKHLRSINIKNNCLIRNLVYDCGDHMTMELDDIDDKRMKFSHDDIDIVNDYIWFIWDSHPTTFIDDKVVTFRELVRTRLLRERIRRICT